MASYTLHTPEASFWAFVPLIDNGIDVEISTDASATEKSPIRKEIRILIRLENILFGVKSLLHLQ